LRTLAEKRLSHAWGHDAPAPDASEEATIEPVQAELRALFPDTNAQRLLQSRALQVSGDIAEAHWLLTESVGDGLPWAFLAVLIFWLGLLFVTFGLLAPANATVIGLLFACALSVAAAVFLIVDTRIRTSELSTSRTHRYGRRWSNLVESKGRAA
jgi:hypothetical protein